MLNHLTAAEALSRNGLDAYLSIKAPALGFSPDLIAKLLERTSPAGVRVHFDSLSAESADRTLALIANAREHHDELGITIPGRWRRSLDDADTAVELGLEVRVVKGQWPAPQAPEQDPRAGFLAVVERLAGRARRVAVATHDDGLAR
jgi:proline dehydrogenase